VRTVNLKKENPTEQNVVIDFPIKLVARNLLIEFKLHQSNELFRGMRRNILMCPLCAKVVEDKYGICNMCGSNALQCRSCRNVNYDNSDNFLCNLCGV